MSEAIHIRLQIRRAHGWQEYGVEVQPDAYILDALEAAYKTDASLLFRHACHHASCGSCGVRVNGRERLACVTRLADVARPGKAVRIEPLRNFPILADLVVDFGLFNRRLDAINLPTIRGAEPLLDTGGLRPGGHIERIPFSQFEDQPQNPQAVLSANRLESCIECGLCISACPIAGSDPQYIGPAGLAAAGRINSEPRGRAAGSVLALVDNTHGLWRCHGSFECTEVCPSGVDPAREIMMLRSQLLHRKMTNDILDERKHETH